MLLSKPLAPFCYMHFRSTHRLIIAWPNLYLALVNPISQLFIWSNYSSTYLSLTLFNHPFSIVGLCSHHNMCSLSKVFHRQLSDNFTLPFEILTKKVDLNTLFVLTDTISGIRILTTLLHSKVIKFLHKLII